MTLQELQQQTLNLHNQPFIGIWRDRAETQDSTTWVSTLRRTHWQTPQLDNEP